MAVFRGTDFFKERRRKRYGKDLFLYSGAEGNHNGGRDDREMG